ncbi:MAG: SRPBCC domain-containing protein [Anaerolineae bacterium]|jgi:hypothetical protein
MRTYSSTATIKASPEAIWGILADASGYPDWEPGTDRVEGEIALGQQVKFFTKLNPNQAFPAKVTIFEPGRRMVLTGGMPLGLFKAERTHTLTENADGSTTFHTQEVFGGVLLPLFGKNIPDLTESFDGFAAGLKAKAEGG